MDQSLEEIVADVVALRNPDATGFAKKILNDWNAGVIPSRAQLNKLLKFLKKDSPCQRLLDDGTCNGWLKKHAQSLDIYVEPPYKCLYTGIDDKDATWRECQGYRSEA